ncbi:Asp23/Gls24 family envelope stress response protein [Actinomycetospora endophytica]|uniref:Asp23/Gls24 family envelope stress response protein n=1 Tax=Actinomycetospora endophytica TaxID=2291215 RepID=A0ABS8P5A4_9PSEU|nr:Asp23/Gls24 family envelope stress response protein [Actinomycetospora endophytica]MCD2193309.1 Asp23/Gls24 family envelope stress response protein [Actinomycetospora endophytica]
MTSAKQPIPPTPPTAGVPEVSGTTEVLPAVVQKVAAYSAREIPGVVALGGAGSRAVGAVRQTLTGSTENVGGVRVELDGDTATVGLDVAIEYGVGARELTRGLRRHVPEAVEQIAGVRITELNIVVTDVVLPGREDEPAPPPAPGAPAATL